MKAEVEVETDLQRVRPALSEVERLRADNSKARKLLGWEPEYAGKDGLRRGLEETVRWFTDSVNQRHYKADLYNI
jgi:nucleoside-diphosphate-sugar epimerase